MASTEIQLPKLGESIHSAVIVKWLKQEGDKVALDEAIVEVSTDKVNSEIPSPVEGTLEAILASPDTEVQVGQPIARIRLSKEEAVAPAPTAPPPPCPKASATSSFYSPAVLQKAHQEGISMQELSAIQGSGEGGRVTRQDLEKYLASKGSATAPAILSSDSTHSLVKMNAIRRAIASSTSRSHAEIPPAAIIHEIDVHALMLNIQQQKEAFFKQFGCKLTLTAFLAKAITEVVVDFPLLNACLEKDHILVKHSVNLSIAVSADQGVVMPVLKHCERKTIPEIAQGIAELAQKTRSQTLAHDDIEGGTLAITNFGMTGVRTGLPIIPFPQVAIFSIGAIQKRVLVVEEDKMAIRHAFDLTLCFDHRVLDGIYACEAVQRLTALLQKYVTLKFA